MTNVNAVPIEKLAGTIYANFKRVEPNTQWQPHEDNLFIDGLTNGQVATVTGRSYHAAGGRRGELVALGKLPRRLLNVRLRADGTTTANGRMIEGIHPHVQGILETAKIETVNPGKLGGKAKAPKVYVRGPYNKKGEAKQPKKAIIRNVIPVQAKVERINPSFSLVVNGTNISIERGAKHISVTRNSILVDF